jgi:hypothetical protein
MGKYDFFCSKKHPILKKKLAKKKPGNPWLFGKKLKNGRKNQPL